MKMIMLTSKFNAEDKMVKRYINPAHITMIQKHDKYTHVADNYESEIRLKCGSVFNCNQTPEEVLRLMETEEITND